MVTGLMCLSCGGTPGTTDAARPSTANVCNGIIVRGTLLDSMTNAPVSRASVAIETGTQRSITPVFDFSVQQSAAASTDGTFRVCANAPTAPTVVVVTAVDANGNAYPPFVSAITSSTNLGTVLMGSCRGTCGFVGQQQTSAPATIEGIVTTSPIAKTGRIVPQFPMDALDGTRNIWGLAMPTFNGQAITFATASGACVGGAPYCTTYLFVVPSQQPMTRDANGGYSQYSAPPNYAMYALTDGSPSCTPPFALAVSQADGAMLTATAGVHLSATTLQFTNCQ